MFVVNSHAKLFYIGRRVVIKKSYNSGMTNLHTGDTGIVEDITIESFPDMNIFNLKIIHFDFGFVKVSFGEPLAKEYVLPL